MRGENWAISLSVGEGCIPGSTCSYELPEESSYELPEESLDLRVWGSEIVRERIRGPELVGECIELERDTLWMELVPECIELERDTLWMELVPV